MRSVAVVGDVADPCAWSGIPYHFWRAGRRAGFISDPVRLDVAAMTWPRRRWAAGRLVNGRRPSGFQYSQAFLNRAEAQIPRELLAGEIISFSQHFPRAEAVRRAGGRISYYIDATFASLSSGRGLNLRLPPDVVERTRRLERDNYEAADRVVTMARWTADSVIHDCGINADRVCTILPGANLELPDGWRPPWREVGQPGRDRPFVLGFVGKDWRRKGLPFLCDARDELANRGWSVVVRAAGAAPAEFASRPGVEVIGYLDKRAGCEAFVDFLASCDVGCLFSEREALGISTLEFLRVGVPVAGYAIEGPADTLPPDAGFRFAAGTPSQAIAERLEAYLKNESEQAAFEAAARACSAALTWDRCVGEFERVWAGENSELFRLVPSRA
jgi:glycosyltransferase involved in cell wall biosynthesis